MAHNITELDLGFVTGGKTWHGRPEYSVVESIGIEDAIKCVDYPVKKLKTYLGTEYGSGESGGHCIARMDTERPTVLAANIGDRYTLIDRKALVNQFDECLLAAYPQLKIAGVGTLGGGRTFWMQFLAERYGVKGDKSDHELRLCFAESYGWAAYNVFCSHVRIVCDNTLRYARDEAIAQGMFAKLRHTAGAGAKINAKAEEFAKLHMLLQKDVEALEYLAGCEANSTTLGDFLDEVLPEPQPAPGEDMPPARSLRTWADARNVVKSNWEHGPETMDTSVAFSRYGLLQAYTDYIDHDSYSRSPYDRWMDSLNGQRAKDKAEAMQWLLQTA